MQGEGDDSGGYGGGSDNEDDDDVYEWMMVMVETKNEARSDTADSP